MYSKLLGFFRKRGHLLLINSLFMLIPLSGAAQYNNPLDNIDVDRAPRQPQYLPKEMLPRMAETLHLDKNDLRLQMMFSESARRRYYRQRDKNFKFFPYDQKRVMGHFRSKKGGEKVLTKEELLKLNEKKIKPNEYIPEIQKLHQKKKKYVAKKRKEAIKRTQDLHKAKRLYKCKADHSKRTERKTFPKNTKQQERSVVDVLFVAPGQKLPPSKDIFGRLTEVHVYRTKNPSIETLDLARLLDVPCLPFRKRHTGRFLFEHHGEHALRNYDDAPHGEGINYLK